MSVHYKFKSALEYDTVTFDGLHISVKDLKKAIIHQKRIGKNTDFDLQVTNAQTKEVYNDENALIPKNTSLIIARIPLAAQSKGKPWEGYGNSVGPSNSQSRPEEGVLSKAVDLTQLDASEDDKIRAMMTQSTLDYDPSNYMKIRGSNQVGAVPSHYRCFKCHQPGHWIKDCPLGHGQEPVEIKKSTGIPRSFMVPVEGPMVPGAMMTPTGQYAVPVLDHQAYTEGRPVQAPAQEEKPEIPEDLVCSICKDLLTDAVMIPCCGNSFCDECIRTILLESEDHECPDCHEKEISPGTLIPNRFLRNSVSNFKNETGYAKRITYRPPVQPKRDEGHSENRQEPTADNTKNQENIPDSQSGDNPNQIGDKPIISEADSTETSKVKEDNHQEKAPKRETHHQTIDKHPPSPKNSLKYKAQPISSVGGQINHHRIPTHTRLPQSAGMEQHSNNGPPGANLGTQYNEERPGTPTVDEPGIGPPGYTEYGDRSPNRTTTLPPMHQNMMGNQGPPGQPPYSNAPPGGFPPTGPPPQGYRMPPPGHPDYNRLPMVSNVDPSVPPPSSVPPSNTLQGYGPPPRQMFDPTRPPYDPHRPPVHGPPPPGYPPYQGGPRGPRGAGFPPSRHIPPGPGPGPMPPGIRAPVITGVIDDPLEAFNRMLREKDERDRRARQARRGTRSRSYSRSRSRSRSSRSFSRSPRRRTRSPTPPRRHRSRTRSPLPRRRTRSRSRSFSMSRSRSFSRSPSFRGSPPPRDYSPRRRPPSRYRSPMPRNSPPPRYNRYKDRPPMDRDRDRDHPPRDRDRDRNDRGDRDRDRERDRIPDRMADRDYQYYDGPPQDYDGYDNRRRGPPHPNFRPRYPPRKDYHQHPPHQGHPPHPPMQNQNDQFYGQPQQDMVHPPTGYNNRYNQNRGPGPSGPPGGPQSYPPPLMSVKAVPPLVGENAAPRRYEDIGPPGLEQPPPPGFENTNYNNERYFDGRPNRDEGPPGVERFNANNNRASPFAERESEARNRDAEGRNRDGEGRNRDGESRNRDGESHPRDQKEREVKRESDHRRETDRSRERNKSRERRYSASPERSVSPRRHSRDRRRHESTERDRKDKGDSDREKKSDKRKDRESEDEKAKRSKEKKRKKAEKKEAERKRRKERKEKKEQEKLKRAEEKRALREEEKLESTSQENLEEKPNEKSPPREELPEKMVENGQNTCLEEEKKPELYDDIPSESIDTNVVAKYGKIKEEPSPERQKSKSKSPPKKEPKETKSDSEEKETSFDGIELQVDDTEFKSEFIENPKKPEVLAPVPEPSKWEREEDLSDKTDKSELKQIFDRPSKVVTSEVIKRAENAIFAKAINAIRPIEIKKISLERAKIYTGEKGANPENISSAQINKEIKNIQVTIPGPAYDEVQEEPPAPEPTKIVINNRDRDRESNTVTKERKTPPPNRLSVKERLGCKVEELDKITRDDGRFDRNRSRTLSPLSRRVDDMNRNSGMGDRRVERVEMDDRRRDYRTRHDRDRRHRDRSRSREYKGNYRTNYDNRNRRDDNRRDRSHSRNRHTDRSHDRNRQHDDRRDHDKNRLTDRERERDRDKDRRDKDRRSRSRSDSRETKKKDSKKQKEKKHKKDKDSKDKRSKHRSEERGEGSKVESKVIVQDRKSESKEKQPERAKISNDERRKTLDEAHFEPDYDLESESDKETSTKKRDRSKSADTESISKKKKVDEDSRKKSDSSSESSDSSEDEKPRKKHRKHKKKKSRKDTSSSSSDSDSDSSVEEKKRKKHKSKKQKKKKKSKHK